MNSDFISSDLLKMKTKRWRYWVGFAGTRKKADRIISVNRIESRSFCKRYSGFFLCKECKGSGFKLKVGINEFNTEVDLTRCKRCELTGVETWIDKMIGGWKNV